MCFRKAGELKCEPPCFLRRNDPPESVGDGRHGPKVHPREVLSDNGMEDFHSLNMC